MTGDDYDGPVEEDPAMKTRLDTICELLDQVGGRLDEGDRYRRSMTVLGGLLAVLAVASIVLGAITWNTTQQVEHQQKQLDELALSQLVDGCNRGNEVRAALRGVVALDLDGILRVGDALGAPALREAQGRPARTPEEQTQLEAALQAFKDAFLQGDAEERAKILAGVQPRDCSPEAVAKTSESDPN